MATFRRHRSPKLKQAGVSMGAPHEFVAQCSFLSNIAAIKQITFLHFESYF